MQIFESYYNEIYQLLEYDDYPNLLKRLIDLSLDTEDISYYKKMHNLVTWYVENADDKAEIKKRFGERLEDLRNHLSNKEIKKSELLLDVDTLTKKYSNSFFALGPISFSISEGEIVGLVGENGNGKTTLLRSLCGELNPSGGNIKYNFDYTNHYDLRTQLIYIPQRTKDWHGTLLSNLQFTASSYGIFGEENEYLVDLVIARMGLWQYRGFGWKGLSSGYKMRFELARMLLRKPKLLLIDEPLANLDILAQQVVLDDFKYLAKSLFRPLGIVLSSQQLYEVEKTSDSVIFLKAGVPQYTGSVSAPTETETSETETTDNQLIIEFESDWNQEQLRKSFAAINLDKLQLKGGTYIAIFPATITQDQFLQTVVNDRISLNYFRNISYSTRRFFLS